MGSGKREVTLEEVAQHKTREQGVWVIIHNKVYDVTEWLDEHPGGSKIILKYAGTDATEEFEPIHPPNVISDNLPAEKYIGPLASASIKKDVVKTVSDEDLALQKRMDARPPLSQMLNLHDFESLARAVMKPAAWNYYSSGCDDEITMRENYTAYQRVWFRPRVCVDVSKVDFSATMLGVKSSMPIYITATALGKLGHPDGELCLTRACGVHDTIQMIPTLASCSLDEMLDAAIPEQTQWLQLYVNADRERTRKIINHAERRGVKGLFITVDAPQLGRREKDMRMKFEAEDTAVQKSGKDEVKKDEGAARAISSFIDPSLAWKDIPYFKTITKMPILLKGIQCWEDALKSYEAGVDGIVLRGRQLEFAPSGIEVLVEVVDMFKRLRLWPLKNFEIYIDGGVRRATDVMKAIALGATGVGIGRPFLYAMSTYGQEGVERSLQILKDEFEMNMRLIGAPTLADLNESMVDARAISQHVTLPGDSVFHKNYENLTSATLKAKL